MNESRSQRSKKLKYAGGILIAVFGLMQFGRFVVPNFKLDNPPVTQEINWDSAETKALWDKACADCHSNETVYPWYSYVAPVGWLVAHDTQEGRETLNVSTGHRIEVHEMVEEIESGEMPMPIYTIMHPDAKLSDTEKEALINGLQATFSGTGYSDGDRDSYSYDDDDDDGGHDDDDDDGGYDDDDDDGGYSDHDD